MTSSIQSADAHRFVRPLIRNEEALTDLLTRIVFTPGSGGKPSDDQLELMTELVKLDQDDEDLLVNLQPHSHALYAADAIARARKMVSLHGTPDQRKRLHLRGIDTGI